jgi:hypothetical protein
MYQLTCESVDLVHQVDSVAIGHVQTVIMLKYFKGTVGIRTLDAYPLKYHPDEKALREALVRRGNKWVGLLGVHHKQYSGIAALKLGDKVVKHNVRTHVFSVHTPVESCF